MSIRQSLVLGAALLALTVTAGPARAQDTGFQINRYEPTTAGEWSFLKANPYPAISLREERVTEKNLPIWRILYRRVA